jgi:hypothetical protein
MRKRHRWVKVRIHVYCCRECGLVRENTEPTPGRWSVLWYLPSGGQTYDMQTPPCEPGPMTVRRLERLRNTTAVSV